MNLGTLGHHNVFAENGPTPPGETGGSELDPAFTMSPEDPIIYDPIEFDASDSEAAESNIVEYRWDFTGNGEVDRTGKTSFYTFKTQSEHEVTLTIVDENGIDLDLLKELKETKRTSLTHYLEKHKQAQYIPNSEYPDDGHGVWRLKADLAFPCATQNELTGADADALLQNGIYCISEGANMPSTADAVDKFLAAKIAYGPGKAANAGGVATSQLEMAQNSSMEKWPLDKVDSTLKAIMENIHTQCAQTAEEFGEPTNLVLGANIAGFRKVANAMIEHGVT